MGGEKMEIMLDVWTYQGSPPHGRGKGYEDWEGVSKERITPAWAGKSFSVSRLGAWCWDHPRMGGEKAMAEQWGELE